MLEIAPIALLTAALVVWLTQQRPPGASLAFAGAPVTDGDTMSPGEGDVEKPAWHDLLMFKKGGSSAPDPDPNIGKAALENVELGRDWQAFAKEQFDIANERQEEIDRLSERVTEMGLATQDQANRWASEDRARYESQYLPIESMYTLDALGGQYLSDEQVSNLLGQRRAQVESELNADYKSRVAEIEALRSEMREVTRSRSKSVPKMSPQAARALAREELGERPVYTQQVQKQIDRNKPEMWGNDKWNMTPSAAYNRRPKSNTSNATSRAQVMKRQEEYDKKLEALVKKYSSQTKTSTEEYIDKVRQYSDADIDRMLKAEQDAYQAQMATLGGDEEQILAARQAAREAEKVATESAAAEAKSDVLSNAQMQRDMTHQQMAAMGLNPNSGRFKSIDAGLERDTALASAGAQNNARVMVRENLAAKRADATNVGRGLPSMAMSSANLGLNAGNAAQGSQLNAQNSWMNNNSIMTQGFQGAMSGNNSGAGILNAQYGNQLSGWNAQQQASAQGAAGLWSGVGTAAGAAMMMSSKEQKTDKRPVEGSAVDKLQEMPVEEWQYKDDSPASDGGQRHVGPYAEDFHKATGKGNGKMIPIIDMLGLQTKAIQEVGLRLDKLEGKGKGETIQGDYEVVS